MKRTTISLPDELGFALEREARRRRTSRSEIAREAIGKHLNVAPGPRKLPFAGIASDPHPDPRYTGARMEEALEELVDEIAEDALGGRRR